jgi:uncharacterized protein (DUF1499 family)
VPTAFLLGVAGVVLLLLSAPAFRAGLGLGAGFGLLLLGGLAGLAAIIASIVAFARGHATASHVAAFVAGLVAFGVPLSYAIAARGLPAIHDITTDTQDPPTFSAVLPLRDGVNGVEVDPQVIAQQRAAYPDIQPLIVSASRDDAFTRALAIVRDSGWTVVAADQAAGRIEATATTRFFAFKDDLVVRLRPVDAGTRVDVRSVSRLGRGDLGVNARRIREYLAKLR